MSQSFETLVDRRANRPRGAHRRTSASIRAALAPLLIGTLLAGCASSPDSKETAYRDLKIFHGAFNRDVITVPVGTPLVLEIGVEGLTTASVDSPGLGIEPTIVPTNAITTGRVHAAEPNDFKVVRIAVRPLVAGRYVLLCQCDGHQDTALIEAR